MVWLTWLGLPVLALVFGITQSWIVASVVLLAGVLAQIAYIRWFPVLSKRLGYGSVTDAPIKTRARQKTPVQVTLYTANVCPFCPIIRKRLVEMQKIMPFNLTEIDVTFKPQIVKMKGLRSVPVIEAGGRLLVGNATSDQIAVFLTELEL